MLVPEMWRVVGKWGVRSAVLYPFFFLSLTEGDIGRLRSCIKEVNCSIIISEIISRHLMNKEITTKIFRKDKQVQTDNHCRKMEEINPFPRLVCFSSTRILKGIADYMPITEFVLFSRM